MRPERSARIPLRCVRGASRVTRISVRRPILLARSAPSRRAIGRSSLSLRWRHKARRATWTFAALPIERRSELLLREANRCRGSCGRRRSACCSPVGPVRGCRAYAFRVHLALSRAPCLLDERNEPLRRRAQRCATHKTSRDFGLPVTIARLPPSASCAAQRLALAIPAADAAPSVSTSRFESRDAARFHPCLPFTDSCLPPRRLRGRFVAPTSIPPSRAGFQRRLLHALGSWASQMSVGSPPTAAAAPSQSTSRFQSRGAACVRPARPFHRFALAAKPIARLLPRIHRQFRGAGLGFSTVFFPSLASVAAVHCSASAFRRADCPRDLDRASCAPTDRRLARDPR